MVGESKLILTIQFNDPELEPEDIDDDVQKLFRQLKQMDEVDQVNRVIDPTPPEDNKAVGGFLVGLLTAEVSRENFGKLMGFLGDRLIGKSVELEVEAADGKRLKVRASSREELELAVKMAQEFVSQ